MTTLASLKEALSQPFAPETIQFLPKDIHQDNGQYTCLALAYANKRVYEDRLNELIFGDWSTPYTAPYAKDNKLIIPATVIICGIGHTDYGEAFFTTAGKNGPREDENTATGAYSQAFRRACSKFLLGRYLYNLPKLRLPFNMKTYQIALTTAERIAWVENLYQMGGLLPKVSAASQPSGRQETTAAQASAQPATEPKTQPQAQRQQGTQPATTQRPNPQPSKVAQEPPTQRTATTPSKIQPLHPSSQNQPTSYPNNTFLDWVAGQVDRNAMRIQDICLTYQVSGLAQLSAKQREDLTQRLRKQANKEKIAVSTPSSNGQMTRRA